MHAGKRVWVIKHHCPSRHAVTDDSPTVPLRFSSWNDGMPRDVTNKSKWVGERAPKLQHHCQAWWPELSPGDPLGGGGEPAPAMPSSSACTLGGRRPSPHIEYKSKTDKRKKTIFKIRVYVKFYTRANARQSGYYCFPFSWPGCGCGCGWKHSPGVTPLFPQKPEGIQGEL